MPLTALRLAALAAAAYFIAAFAAVAVVRAGYPYELDWMEGEIVNHTLRVLAGDPLYVEPSLRFVSFLYTPLYYFAGALVAEATGIGFLPLRAVSVLATLATLAAIYVLVRRSTANAGAGLLAAGLYAATYPLVDTYFDIARCDSLATALLVAGIAVAGLGRTVGSALLAGLCVSLAFYAKQAMLLPGGVAGACLLLGDRRRAVAFAAVVAVLVGGGTLVLDAHYGGWYRLHVFDLARRHEIVERSWTGFWTEDLLHPLGVAVTLALVPLLPPTPVRRRLAYLALGASMAGASWLARLHSGGWLNVLMPAYAAVAIGAGLGIDALGRRASPAICALAHVALLVQLAGLYRPPASVLPGAAHRAASDRLLALIASFDGPVLVPGSSYYPVMAGKPSYAHLMAIQDVARAPGHEVMAEKVLAEMDDALRARRFGAVILDRPGPPPGLIEGGYVDAGPVLEDAAALVPIAGLGYHPRFLYVPGGRAAAGARIP